MTTVGIAEAKNMLPELIRAVEAGEQVVITRHGVPVAQIAPPPPTKRKVILGGMEGQIRFKPGWDEAITEEDLLGSRL
ncbi:type II toxin-antitoxin system Phd/YefM family antitoxin [Acidicapsa dinghuensis]|uniref:Antitoxin n=1 Tax=Acidicapsa dinghuensis TaxID=2218256 RepID=A0ABW1EEK0_9BACT|nr:type II toxin-antitoxin system prevent-host-death family antitoxin [Acidicapsa dinghuensis]